MGFWRAFGWTALILFGIGLLVVASWILVPILLWDLALEFRKAKDRCVRKAFVVAVIASIISLLFLCSPYAIWRGEGWVLVIACGGTWITNMIFEDMWDAHILQQPCSM